MENPPAAGHRGASSSSCVLHRKLDIAADQALPEQVRRSPYPLRILYSSIRSIKFQGGPCWDDQPARFRPIGCGQIRTDRCQSKTPRKSPDRSNQGQSAAQELLGCLSNQRCRRNHWYKVHVIVEHSDGANKLQRTGPANLYISQTSAFSCAVPVNRDSIQMQRAKPPPQLSNMNRVKLPLNKAPISARSDRIAN